MPRLSIYLPRFLSFFFMLICCNYTVPLFAEPYSAQITAAVAAGAPDSSGVLISYNSGILAQSSLEYSKDATASFNQVAPYGVITTYADVFGSVTPDGKLHGAVHTSVSQPSGCCFIASPGAFATVNIASTDTITLTSTTLPIGTAVEWTAQLWVETANVHYPSPSDADIHENYASYQAIAHLNTEVPDGITLSLERHTCCSGFIGLEYAPVSGLLSGHIGESFTVNMSFGLLALSTLYTSGSTTFAESYVDGSHSGYLNLIPQTDGLTFASAAGYSYDHTVVPEPSSINLIVAGLGVFFAFQVRRRAMDSIVTSDSVSANPDQHLTLDTHNGRPTMAGATGTHSAPIRHTI
jgi:hypothetical protein